MTRQTDNKPGQSSSNPKRKSSLPAMKRPKGFRITKKTIYIALAFFSAVLIIVSAALMKNLSSEKDYSRYMQDAREHYRIMDYDGALASLRMASSIEKTYEALLLTADCYEALGNFDKALEALRLMDTKDPYIAERIQNVELRKKAAAEANFVTIAGTSYSDITSGLVLDNKGLGNEVLTEISQLYYLNNLSLAGNNIDNISALSSRGGLTTLNLSNNKISDISALSSLTNLRTLYIDNNPVTDLSPLCSLTQLTTLSIKGIALTERSLEELSLALPNCAIHSENAIEDINDISLGGITFKADVRELNLSGMGIWDVSVLSSCTYLEYLNLSGNDISDISPLMDIPNLKHLDISANNVTDIRPLMNMRSISFLNLSDNNVYTTVPINQLTALTELYLSGNPITDFAGLRPLKSLKRLGLANTGFRSQDVSYLKLMGSLSYLDISDNPDISGEAVAELTRTLGFCEIIHSDLVYTIDIGGFQIPSDSVELDLSGTGISDISGISGLKNLEIVLLSDNNISNIYPFQYTQSAYTITYLDLSFNGLSDITALASLSNLQTLDLRGNNITSVLPLMSLTNLRVLYLGGNQLSDTQLFELETALVNCIVYYD